MISQTELEAIKKTLIGSYPDYIPAINRIQIEEEPWYRMAHSGTYRIELKPGEFMRITRGQILAAINLDLDETQLIASKLNFWLWEDQKIPYRAEI